MNNLFDLITKSGYELQTIGNGTLPCTIIRQNEPVAILMPDFTLRMVTGAEASQPELHNMIQFSLDNQGMETLNEGFKLSQYKNVYLTTAYDLENHKPIFYVYQLNGESMDLLFSSDEQAKAAEMYAQRSGLVQEDVFQSQQQEKESRLQNFLRLLQTHGFHIHRSQEKTHRYEITDQNGKSVGFIGTDNRAVITSDNFRVRREVSQMYQNSNEPVAKEDKDLSRWRQLLHNIGYSIRLFFGKDGMEPMVQNGQHQTVAAVKDQEVQFTQQATSADKAQLSQAQQQLREELQAALQQVPTEPQQTMQQERPLRNTPTAPPITQQTQQKVEQQAAARQVTEVQEQQEETEALVAEEQASDDIVLTSEEAQILASILYENRDSLPALDSSLIDKLSQPAPVQNTAPPVPTPNAEKAAALPDPMQPANEAVRPLSQQEQNIQADFQKAYTLLQTMQGFESPDSLKLQKDMMQTYGTTSLKEFDSKLAHGDYAGKPSLEQQLRSASKEAHQMNNSRLPSQEHAQERSV